MVLGGMDEDDEAETIASLAVSPHPYEDETSASLSLRSVRTRTRSLLMARKLTLDLTVEQTRTLHEVAARRKLAGSEEDRARWNAIEREASRALTYEAERVARRSESRG